MADGYVHEGDEFEEEEVWSVMKGRLLEGSPKAKSNTNTGKSPASQRHSASGSRRVYQQSAPRNIPDWSKVCAANEDDGEDGDDDGDDKVVPPHEWIAKKFARSQISSFSVCEGVGRTLKGRDLSKVRNAVLTRTGFLE